ncbi:prepilin peptidase [Azotosporobacter soli]|uniref:prepilin peptidase n=1 Tax=Azotosporobacter soli TaxID=3055040 RepID=UPI0031FF43F9
MEHKITFLIFWMVFGAVIGSFINVCVYRIPRQVSLLFPRSHCPSCSTSLSWIELIPLIGYLWNRGRCRYCDRTISSRYPIVEVAMAGFGGFSALNGADLRNVLAIFTLSAFVLLIAIIDYDWQIIYDKVVIAFAISGIMIGSFQAESWQWMLSEHGAAVSIGAICLLSIALASHGGLGLGDVKFAAAAGIWLSWQQMILMLFIAFSSGGLIACALIFFGCKDRKDLIPFGPFLTLGLWLTYVYGKQIMAWYWVLFA